MKMEKENWFTEKTTTQMWNFTQSEKPIVIGKRPKEVNAIVWKQKEKNAFNFKLL